MVATVRSIWEKFEWWRDPDGYSMIAPKGPHSIGRITRNGGKLQSYRPLEFSDGVLPAEFSNVRSADDLLKFVEKYGPLTEKGMTGRLGEYVVPLIQNAALMRQVMFNEKTGRGTSGTAEIPLGSIRASLGPEHGRMRVNLELPDLLCAIWLRLSERLSGGITFFQCKHCLQPFERGPGTPRRADQEYCEISHRTAYNNEKRRGT